MSSKIGDLLSAFDVIESDDFRVAGSCEIDLCRRKLHCADGFDETAQAVSEALRAVVEQVDCAVLVARRCQRTPGREVNRESEGTLGLVMAFLGGRITGYRINVDVTGVACGGEIVAVGGEGESPGFACFLSYNPVSVHRALSDGPMSEWLTFDHCSLLP